MASCLVYTGHTMTLTDIFIPCVLDLTIHTTFIIVIDSLIIAKDTVPSALQCLRKAIRVSSNIRIIRLVDDIPIRDRPAEQTTFRFAIHGLASLLALNYLQIALEHTSWKVLPNSLIKLLSAEVFGPRSEIVPDDTRVARQAMSMQLMTCLSWIGPTCVILTRVHDFLALLHVVILGLNSPSEWPPVFGYLIEAYSLRRFWGVFWHKLHVPIFEAWMPSLHGSTYLSKFCCCRVCCSLDGKDQGQTSSSIGGRPSSSILTGKACRSLWIFFMSAMCISLVNGWGLGGMAFDCFQTCSSSLPTGHFVRQRRLWVISYPKTCLNCRH